MLLLLTIKIGLLKQIFFRFIRKTPFDLKTGTLGMLIMYDNSIINQLIPIY